MKWSDLMDLRWKDLRKVNREDVLHRLGLEEHTPTSDFFSGLGLFAVGVIAGAALGLLFAPRPGAEIRGQLGQTLRNRVGRASDEYAAGASEASSPTITSPGTTIS